MKSTLNVHEKARIAIAARDTGDLRFVELVIRLAARLDLDPRHVEMNIEQLAKGGVA